MYIAALYNWTSFPHKPSPLNCKYNHPCCLGSGLLFKEIAIAYQTLSDPALRRKYNEFGPKESAPEGGFVDPEEIFGTIFGGEKFTESFGVELLQAVGFVYVSKARHFLASSQSIWGVGGWLQGVQNRYHVISETVSTVRAALEVKQVFEQLAEAEKTGVTPEQKKKLEEQAAEKGMQALFKGAKLEIESVLRETCDRVLNPVDPPIPQSKAVLRATALEVLGEAFMNVKKDVPSVLEEDYVRVDTAASKARDRKESTAGSSGPWSPTGR
ncbi:hypothetical protein FRB91_005641 [Serendipita sp. 411]|nr:hypothetical protein FRB91_005641 [Serendipita sp. 411]